MCEDAGKKIVILAGRGALHATDELEQLAELLAAPIAKPLLGKASVPDDSPYTTGGVGQLGTKASQEALEQCDGMLDIDANDNPLRTRACGPLGQVRAGTATLGDAPGLGIAPDLAALAAP